MHPFDDRVFSFENVTLDLGRGSLRNAEGDVELRPKSFEVLAYLVANAGRLVPREELLQAIWPRVTVTEESLTRCISDIRLALQDREANIIKTVARRGYRVDASVTEARESAAVPSAAAEEVGMAAALPLPKGPSIAILPFQNLSGDAEQDYFADGVVEEITVALSRFKWLFVVSRNSSFHYKNKPIDIRQVGRELGVRYVLEGSVRNADGQLRITGQLIDTESGTHIWADRFQGKLSDIFALQDEFTLSVVAAIEPRLLQAEIQLAVRRRPDNLSAYDLYLRAFPHFYLMTPQGLSDARRLCLQALELDERYGAAAIIAAECHMLAVALGWSKDSAADLERGMRLAKLALNVDENDPDTLASVARMTAHFLGDREAATDLADRAVALNPNSWLAWSQRGWTCIYCSAPVEAIRSFERAMRLSPLDPMMYVAAGGLAYCYVSLGRFEEAVIASRKALRQNADFSPAFRALAAALAHLGRGEEAKAAVEQILRIEPGFTISVLLSRSQRFQPDVFLDGLRKAGIPE